MSKLKRLRVLNGMRQEDLAEKLGCSQSFLSRLERNKCEIPEDINKKIEEIFGYLAKFID